MLPLFFLSLFILLFLSVPVAVALGLATTIGIMMHDTIPLMTVAQRIFISINSFPLMAIPFFILAGNLMQVGGLSKRLVTFASSLVGHMTGGLAMVAILTSMFFAAISGSGAATTAAIGAILIPAMVAQGYSREFASANQAVSGALGVIIPPSISLILFGVSANVSVSDMFIAGFMPGLLITFSLLVMAYFVSKKRGYIGIEKSTTKEVLISFKQAILALLMPVIILGGIYGGIFTPTEAAVVAVAYSLLVGVVIYREITMKKLVSTLIDSAVTTAIVMIIIGTAGLFSFFVSITGVPGIIMDSISGIITNAIIFILILNLILLIAGMFLEGAAAILIFTPLLLPVAVNLGIDPIHFGIIMVVNLAIGLVTPPVGINLFVAAQISNLTFNKLSKAVIPFLFVLVIDILIISYIPALSTWLPELLK
ncbi:TRAP transporter large permease [Alkalihalobacillus sp. MEB130]|uniref:TRAP transporter large permease n=1 Tax=Alkalihalobacillus sp. MEB130 TaxID=2976704 RepID=UPI0028DD40EF|nr:TRAP transporter large permease [Alkalihalobacillus sp. MEB130]MDT8858928.1 TRAP transporter large permease [Alkalihalobacillus sp. MEB130]